VGINKQQREPKMLLNALLFGGCLVHWPLVRTARAQEGLAPENYGPIREVHTFGEMFQIIEVLRGQKTVPQEWRHLAHMRPDLGPVPGADRFSDIDVALVEPASPTELEFRGTAINRFAIARFVRATVGDGSKETEKILAKWLRLGLVALNDTVRAEAGEQLVERVRGDTADAELARAVIRETRAYPSDIGGGFRKMQELLGCPIGAVIYVFKYMPDGRPISWPAGFREQVLFAAEDLGLPVFDPAPLVVRHGVQAALAEGLSHYSAEFLPVAGEALLAFARSVCEGTAAPGPAMAGSGRAV
jgi:hypothetical protein